MEKIKPKGGGSLTKKIVKPEYVNSSIGAVLKYSFDTEKELEIFFLSALAKFQEKNIKTKVIGKSLIVFTKNNQEAKNVSEQIKS